MWKQVENASNRATRLETWPVLWNACVRALKRRCCGSVEPRSETENLYQRRSKWTKDYIEDQSFYRQSSFTSSGCSPFSIPSRQPRPLSQWKKSGLLTLLFQAVKPRYG